MSRLLRILDSSSDHHHNIAEMATTLPPPGTMSRVLRHLGHIRPSTKNPAGKFSAKGSSFTQPKPRYVQPRDRIAYWNIVPGDEVQCTVGGKKIVDESTGKITKVPWEGIVATIDRERNLVYLRGSEDDKGETKIPKSLKNIGSRMKDPDKGVEGGYTPTTVHTVKPIHYSNLRYKLPKNLKLPKDIKQELNLKEGVYASRLTRSKVWYSTQFGHFVWKRYAVVPSDNGVLKIEIPWKFTDESRPRILRNNASVLENVDKESWIPWSPTDPFRLISGRKRTSPQALERYVAAIEQQQKDRAENEKKPAKGIPVMKAKGKGYGKKEGVKAPLLPQPPTPSEQIWQVKQDVKDWMSTDKVKEHIESGGKTFTALDYLEITPRDGPSDLQWFSLSSEKASPSPSSTADSEVLRNLQTGKLLTKVTKDDVDSWPVELLMKDDLENPMGLRHRMRRWHVKQVEKKELAKAEKEADGIAVDVLRSKVAEHQQEVAAKKAKEAAQKAALEEVENNASAESPEQKTIEQSL